MDPVKPARIKGGQYDGYYTITGGQPGDVTPSRATAQKWADAENRDRREARARKSARQAV